MFKQPRVVRWREARRGQADLVKHSPEDVSRSGVIRASARRSVADRRPTEDDPEIGGDDIRKDHEPLARVRDSTCASAQAITSMTRVEARSRSSGSLIVSP